MVSNRKKEQTESTAKRGKIREFFSYIPLLSWFLGILAAVLLERFIGAELAEDILGLRKIPVLFGFTIALKTPMQIPAVLTYTVTIYCLPITLVSKYGATMMNGVAESLTKLPLWVSVLVHLLVLYGILHIWADVSAYRELTVKLMFIAIMMTLSLNVINGYMGEFSCSHPGFMALGAYGTSVLTVLLFSNDRLFGEALITTSSWAFLFFPLALIAGGLFASFGALLIAIPSFKTRGDYLAIISLAFLFIVKSIIENLEIVGGPRGLSGQPNWANLPTVFAVCVVCVWIVNNFVRSIVGKATNAVRDDETAANAMTIDTRRTKLVAFLFSAFWAGVAGGLFAHVLRYVNPGTFYIQKLAEVLAMVYFGGLNSVYGSIVGAVSLSVLGEALRPLQMWKWIIIPLLLILVMIFRPKGLISFKEFKVGSLVQPKRRTNREV